MQAITAAHGLICLTLDFCDCSKLGDIGALPDVLKKLHGLRDKLIYLNLSNDLEYRGVLRGMKEHFKMLREKQGWFDVALCVEY